MSLVTIHCPNCNGTGKTKNFLDEKVTCLECKGKGIKEVTQSAYDEMEEKKRLWRIKYKEKKELERIEEARKEKEARRKDDRGAMIQILVFSSIGIYFFGSLYDKYDYSLCLWLTVICIIALIWSLYVLAFS